MIIFLECFANGEHRQRRSFLVHFIDTGVSMKAIVPRLSLILTLMIPPVGSTAVLMGVCKTDMIPPSGTPSRTADAAIEAYFKNFEILARSENWKEIIEQGKIALEASRIANRPQEEAKICTQLASTAFYLGDFPKALEYVSRCHELSKEFQDPSLFVRALYLESAIYRALAQKQDEEQDRQAYYLRAAQIAEEASHIYFKNELNCQNLLGKIYFNWGAAHADNPKGDLEKAADCYSKALGCFQNIEATDDLIRTSIRLGKVYLMQKKYDLSQKIIDVVRPQITVERLAIHADYLEAQLKFAQNDLECAIKIARKGLLRAVALGAKEDESRLASLLERIENSL